MHKLTRALFGSLMALALIFGVGATATTASASAPQAVPRAMLAGNTSTLLGGRLTYTFEKGDSLPDIAEHFSVNLKTLRKANGLATNRVIPGTVLTIPTPNEPDVVSPHILRKIEPQPGDGKVIYVSLSQQKMWAYDGDQLVFEFLVSTGLPTEENPNRDTKPGVFRIKTKMPEAFANLWGLRMPYWMGIYDAGNIENGFHAMPLLRNGRPVTWRVGTRGSFGCIVLNTKDAKALYDWAGFGTLAVIRN